MPKQLTKTLDLTNMPTKNRLDTEGWHWISTTKVLYISNINIHSDSSVGVILPPGSFIVVKDNTENIIKTAEGANTVGLYCGGDLSIMGQTKECGGRLTIKAGNATMESFGIKVEGERNINFTIGHVNLTSCAGAAAQGSSRGIYCNSQNMSYLSILGSNVSAWGNEAAFSNSYGIYVSDDNHRSIFVFNDSTLDAKAGKGGPDNFSEAIFVRGHINIFAGEVTAISGQGGYSSGIRCRGYLTIGYRELDKTNPVVVARAKSGPPGKWAYGIAADGDNVSDQGQIFINSGTLMAKAQGEGIGERKSIFAKLGINFGEDVVITRPPNYTKEPKPISVDISGRNVGIGAPLPIGMFKFALMDEEGAVVKEAITNRGCGTNICFDQVLFETPGVYNYTIRAITKSILKWKMDKRVFPISVVVKDDGRGGLVARVDSGKGEILFTNTWCGSVKGLCECCCEACCFKGCGANGLFR